MAGGQQRGADAPALAAGVNGQDREVLVRRPGRVVVVQHLVEDGEPAGPRRGRGGQPLHGDRSAGWVHRARRAATRPRRRGWGWCAPAR